MSASPLRIAVRLEWAEARRSRVVLAIAIIECVLALVFLLVGLRESTIMGYTGTGRVLLSFSHALLLVLPLLALVATGQSVNAPRENGTLEFLLSQPLSRTTHFIAVTLVRALVVLGPLLLAGTAIAAFGRLAYADPLPGAFMVRAGGVVCALVSAFVGLGMLISTGVRGVARSLVYVLFAWAAAVALLDFALVGVALQWRLTPQALLLLSSLNPVEAARVALLVGADPELVYLGPVGLFLSTRIGSTALTVYGIGWPLALGASAWALALRRFRTLDLV